MKLFTRKNRIGYKTRKNYKLLKQGGNAIEYPPESINKYIEHVVYVNLDSSKDRRKNIENQLKIFDKNKIHRIPGIVPEIQDTINRNIALAKAHLNAIIIAKKNKWKNTLFLEDDSRWANIKSAYPVFERLIKQPYDAIMLAALSPQYNKNTFRVTQAFGGSAYLLYNSHYDIVIKKIQEMLSNYKPGVTNESDVLVDSSIFTVLQKTYKWYVVSPGLMIQAPGYSDRERIYVNKT